MKNFKTGMMLIAAIALSTFTIGCDNNQNDNHQDGGNDHSMMENMPKENMDDMMEESNNMSSEMSPMMKSYIDIKDALVADDAQAAKQAAQNMMDISEISDAMKSSLKGIAGSEDLKTKRKYFSELSEQMYTMAKNGDLGKTLYWNHCPMAMDGQGANWLSDRKVIQNPYMGQSMPKCGSVKETLDNN